jgi:hypothetical protein
VNTVSLVDAICAVCEGGVMEDFFDAVAVVEIYVYYHAF